MSTTNIQQRYIDGLAGNLPSLDRKASEAIKSFAELVEELNKVSKLSTGTPAKEQLTKLTGELNNTSVFFAKMLGDELGKIHEIVTPGVSKETTESIV